MSTNCNSIIVILLCFIDLSQLVLADDKVVSVPQNKTRNKIELKWLLSRENDDLLYLEWKILDSDYFGNIDHFVLKWNFTKISCNPPQGEFGAERLPHTVRMFDVTVTPYARYSIILCVESDKVTCENFSVPFETGYIATKIAGDIEKYELPVVKDDDIIWENMTLNIYFETVDCRAIRGPLEVYFEAFCEEGTEDGPTIGISALTQYPLENNRMVITDLVPYYLYKITIYFVRKGDVNAGLHFSFPFVPDYGVITETIRNLTVTSQGPDHIALRWLPPHPPSDTLHEYYVNVESEMHPPKSYVIDIMKCAQWAQYHCYVVALTDGGHYNISVFALNRYDAGKVKLEIEVQHAAKKDLFLAVETNIRGSKSKKKSQPIVECQSESVTKLSGEAKVCPGDKIIDYKFSGDSVDSDIWTVEQYISADPDWAFNIYRPDVVSVQSDGLHIKPKLEEKLARANLNLNPGCTQIPKRCHRNFMSIWNPPVVSGQLRSKISFCFGNITLRAKLPIGDYMYPELYLEDVGNPERRLLIAYARGNLDYVYVNGLDDGGKKLFGGPHTDIQEPDKFRYLSTYVSHQHIGASWHTFNVIWLPDKIELYMDGEQFGHYNSYTVQATDFDKEKLVRVVVGIGVGGSYHFPDGYTSSNKKKPYKSYSNEGIKNFVTNKKSWLSTWNEDSQLLVDFVTVTAL